MLAVTGATGHLGRLVVGQLLTRVPAADVVAIVRNPSSAGDIASQGVTVRSADYKKPDAWAPALAGVSQLLLISSNDFDDRAGQHRNVLRGAVAAGVRHIVYTSILRGTESPLILGADHAATERELEGLGVPFTVLRNGWYHENFLGQLGATLSYGVAGCSGNGRISGAARADYAAAAVAVLTSSGHEGKRYELGGDTSYTKADIAAEIQRQAGKPVPYAELPPEGFKAVLTSAGLPAVVADIFVDADVQTAKGALQDDSRALSRLLGRPTTSLTQAVQAALGALR
jgi:NAD(P)H dehydrogenase (quinone)